jgi:hypothetical protein
LRQHIAGVAIFFPVLEALDHIILPTPCSRNTNGLEDANGTATDLSRIIVVILVFFAFIIVIILLAAAHFFISFISLWPI